MYRPAQVEMAEAAAWLATEEGHQWQNSQARAIIRANDHHPGYGLTGKPWISIKYDQFRAGSDVHVQGTEAWWKPAPRYI